MDVLAFARLLAGETLVIILGLYSMVSAWNDGLMLYAGTSFALVGVAFALAGERYNNAT